MTAIPLSNVRTGARCRPLVAVNGWIGIGRAIPLDLHRIGSALAGGDARSADTPRLPRQPSLAHWPDEGLLSPSYRRRRCLSTRRGRTDAASLLCRFARASHRVRWTPSGKPRCHHPRCTSGRAPDHGRDVGRGRSRPSLHRHAGRAGRRLAFDWIRGRVSVPRAAHSSSPRGSPARCLPNDERNHRRMLMGPGWQCQRARVTRSSTRAARGMFRLRHTCRCSKGQA
jgi:hypothetical protein